MEPARKVAGFPLFHAGRWENKRHEGFARRAPFFLLIEHGDLAINPTPALR